MWWSDAVVYQVYPRSFQDSGGDGEGDLPGITARLDHLVWLGVDALWLSPVYPSPMADGGYDVADYCDVDSRYGSLADLDALLEAAHARGLRVLMDLVPSHTSIEHPWFREHPDWYITAPERPNNWISTFGGPAWSFDAASGRWYLHSFYPEQPDLDWRNPEVVAALQGVVRFWLERGVDGFRIDALDRLFKDELLRDDPVAQAPFALPLDNAEYASLSHVHSTNAPDIQLGVRALREAAGDAFLVGEVYLPAAEIAPYLESLDSAFSFDLLHAPFEAAALRGALGAALAELRHVSWVLSNHDFARLPNRVGFRRERAAALLLLTLPGAAFVYQGDEIGMPDGRGTQPPIDRAGRDRHRHPMQWEPEPNGGFTSGRPWLALIDPRERNVAAQREDQRSLLSFYRALIDLRRELRGAAELIDAEAGVVAFRRGEHAVAINVGDDPCRVPVDGEVVLATHEDALREDALAPSHGVVLRERRP